MKDEDGRLRGEFFPPLKNFFLRTFYILLDEFTLLRFYEIVAEESCFAIFW